MIQSLRKPTFLLALSTLLATAPLPAYGAPTHLVQARALVNQILPANNSYNSDHLLVFPGDGGTIQNHTVCAPFMTLLLEHAYALDDAFFTSLISSTSPFPADYLQAIHEQRTGYTRSMQARSFKQILNITDVQPGDIIAIRYDSTCTGGAPTTVTGHVLLVEAAPVFVNHTPDGDVFKVSIIDSTSTNHGSDDTRVTRPDNATTTDTGVGRGTIALIANSAGLVTAYKWTVNSSVVCTQTQRPLVIGRLSNAR